MGTRQSDLVPGVKDSEGPFIPLCVFCYNQRIERREQGKPSLPLGVEPPGAPEQFLKQKITVITQSGSRYILGLPNKKGLRKVSCKKRKLGFSKCNILLLEKGNSLWLRGVDVDSKDAHWRTSPVTSIY